MNSKYKNILLTGATGYVGSLLLPRLLNDNCAVTITLRGTSNVVRIEKYLNKIEKVHCGKEELEACFQKNRFDLILHCATNYGRAGGCIEDILKDNLLFPAMLLTFAEKYGVGAFINLDTTLEKEVSLYANSKWEFRERLKEFDLPIKRINLKLGHFYGPNDGSSKFISRLINSFLLNEAEIKLTAGEQIRDFIYIEDLLDAIMCVKESLPLIPDGFTEYIIGSGAAISIKEMVTKLKGYFPDSSTLLKFGDIPYRKDEPMTSSLDLAGIKSLGWSPKYSLDEGIAETIRKEKNVRGL